MKPFEHIENCKRVVNNLKFKLQYSKNKEKDAEDINTLIKALNSFDDMLVYKYKTDAIDSLITYIIEDYLSRYYVECNGDFSDGLPLHEIIRKIDVSLKDNSNESTYYLSSSINSYLIGSGVINKDFKKVPDILEIQKLVKETLTEIKKYVVWKK